MRGCFSIATAGGDAELGSVAWAPPGPESAPNAVAASRAPADPSPAPPAALHPVVAPPAPVDPTPAPPAAKPAAAAFAPSRPAALRAPTPAPAPSGTAALAPSGATAAAPTAIGPTTAAAAVAQVTVPSAAAARDAPTPARAETAPAPPRAAPLPAAAAPPRADPPPAPASPSASTSKESPAPTCDADALARQAEAARLDGRFEEAITLLETAYDCRPDPLLTQKTFINACNARNPDKARETWHRMSRSQQTNSLLACLRNGITEAQLDAPQQADAEPEPPRR
jgi:hypothetical protein